MPNTPECKALLENYVADQIKAPNELNLDNIRRDVMRKIGVS